jgi:ATP-dependent protease ClpP protease subunit
MPNDDADIMRWFGWNDVCCPADIENALAELPEGEEVTVWINSTGGDLFSGLDMYHALKNAKAPTTAKITTCAASAASVAAMGCSVIEADAASVICVHDPSCWAKGAAEDLRKTADELDTF